MKQAFDLRQQEFDQNVQSALTNVAQAILRYNNHDYPLQNPVRQLSSSYYVVMVNEVIDNDLLKALLTKEFEQRGIRLSFHYTIYDCANDDLVYGDYISFGNTPVSQGNTTRFPKWRKDNYYFGISFVNKDLALIGQMGFWLFSSGVLLLVIVFFSYTLFIILKQKRLSEIQKDFINNMTHEFKTPIATIAISSDVLKNPSIVHNPERLLNYASIIGEEANRLKSQVERVLQMASVEKDEIRLKKEAVNLHETIRKAVEHNQLSLTNKGGNINFDLRATQPYLQADSLHLTNILYNLLDNAIKYTRHAPEISIATYNTKQGICLSIQDNGIGIGREEQKKIFDKFYRVPTGNLHDVKGFGLGLNYVRGMVKAHGGSIQLESEPDKGSTFRVFLPLN